MDHLVDPATGCPLRVIEVTKAVQCSPTGWKRCARWCGRYWVTPDQVDRNACEGCLSEELLDGTIQSDGGVPYPVLRGIPRMLEGSYLTLIRGLPAEWTQRYAQASMVSVSKFDSIQIQTGQGFAEEWLYFSKRLPDYESIARSYFDLVSPEQFRGVTLDAGCGMGRWARYAAGKGETLIAADLSSAVDVAAQTLESLPNTHVVQADIHRLPFRSETFDLIYSLGVLHHLPEPERGLRSLVGHLKPGGSFLAYFYYALDNRPRYFRILLGGATALRALICRLPYRLARWVCFAIALFVYWPLLKLGHLLQALGFKEAARQVPLYEFYAGKSFSILFNDSVDRFATALEFRFTREQIQDMLSRVGLQEPRFSDSTPFWKVAAFRPTEPGLFTEWSGRDPANDHMGVGDLNRVV